MNHAPREKFDTLFADPRHYRSDCRLACKAIRRGWIKPEDRDAFVRRFVEAAHLDVRDPRFGFSANLRRLLRTIYVVIEMERENDRAAR